MVCAVQMNEDFEVMGHTYLSVARITYIHIHIYIYIYIHIYHRSHHPPARACACTAPAPGGSPRGPDPVVFFLFVWGWGGLVGGVAWDVIYTPPTTTNHTHNHPTTQPPPLPHRERRQLGEADGRVQLQVVPELAQLQHLPHLLPKDDPLQAPGHRGAGGPGGAALGCAGGEHGVVVGGGGDELGRGDDEERDDALHVVGLHLLLGGVVGWGGTMDM